MARRAPRGGSGRAGLGRHRARAGRAARGSGRRGAACGAGRARRARPVYRGPQPIDVVPGANVALPRATVLALGGYDERLGAGTRFSAADDNDMGHRLLLAGCEVRHVPAAVVYHRAWRLRRGAPAAALALRARQGGVLRQAREPARPPACCAARSRTPAVGCGARSASLPRSPRITAAELVSLAGLAAGALDWLVPSASPRACAGGCLESICRASSRSRREPPRGGCAGSRGCARSPPVRSLVHHVWLLDGGVRLGADGWADVIFLNLALGVTLFFALSGFLLYRPFAAAIARRGALPCVRELPAQPRAADPSRLLGDPGRRPRSSCRPRARATPTA